MVRIRLWAATIPNPVEGGRPGWSWTTVYYLSCNPDNHLENKLKKELFAGLVPESWVRGNPSDSNLLTERQFRQCLGECKAKRKRNSVGTKTMNCRKKPVAKTNYGASAIA